MVTRRQTPTPPQAQPAQAGGAVAGGQAQQGQPPQAAAGVPTKEPGPLSTQNSLLISELRDNMAIMKDGSFRAVVACKSINFDLMSTSEREGIEYSYQNFINSLNFTTQILIRSQRVDLGPYIEKLEAIRNEQDNMLLNMLMDDYIDFIDLISQRTNIMDKSFFVVIPYFTTEATEKVVEHSKSFFKNFFNSGGQQAVTKIDKATYDKAVSEIDDRVSSVVSGLYQIGIHCVRLKTKELGALFYNFNNPDTALREPLGDFKNITSMYIRKGEGEAPQPHLRAARWA